MLISRPFLSRRGLLWLATGLACLLPAALRGEEAPAPAPLRVRVLSYNLHHGEGIDRQLDLKRLADVIQSVEPDLVSLQEVDQKVARTGGVDQPAEFARLTGLEVAFGGNIDLQGGRYGNAVLSRWPIKSQKNHLLPRFDDGEQRGVLAVQVAPPGRDGPLWLLATHFDHRRDERERIASAAAVNTLIAKERDAPAILAGDLNATPESRTLRTLGEGWTVANQQPLPTIPVEQPTRQIDFILFRPAQRWRVVEVRVLDEAVASDHRAIFAVLELR